MRIDIFNQPPSDIPPTHYNTRGGMLSEYLLLDGQWYLKCFGWTAVKEPPYKALIGEPETYKEQLNAQTVTETKAKPVFEYKEPEIYPSDRKHWVGD